MFSNLNVLDLARAAATHAAQRQTVIARNIANADTPGYRARDIPSFPDTLAQGGFAPRTTRAGHLAGRGADARPWREFETATAPVPGRNTVVLEEEMLKAVELRRQHDRAVAVYRSAMTLLRTGLGRI